MLTESTVAGTRKVYLYTPTDERIAAITTVNNARTDATWTVRNTGGAVLRRYYETATRNWTWSQDYIYADGRLLAAEVNAPEKTLHFFSDHLGSPRLITGSRGAEFSRRTFYPFGRETAPAPQDYEAMRFTGHERDAATLDYMHARSYLPMWGRFLSVDPSGRRDASAPQSWNRYVYAHNNPLLFVDPDGRDAYPIGPAMQNAVRHGLTHSPEFARMYSRLRDDPRVYWHIAESQAAAPGTPAHSDIHVVWGENGAITRLLIFTRVPTPGNNLNVQTGLTGHEGSHGDEVLNTGQTLGQRHAAGDATVWPNPAAGPNAFESAFAQAFEQQVLQELQSGVVVISPTQSLQDLLLPEPTRNLRDILPPQGGVVQ